MSTARSNTTETYVEYYYRRTHHLTNNSSFLSGFSRALPKQLYVKVLTYLNKIKPNIDQHLGSSHDAVSKELRDFYDTGRLRIEPHSGLTVPLLEDICDRFGLYGYIKSLAITSPTYTPSHSRLGAYDFHPAPYFMYRQSKEMGPFLEKLVHVEDLIISYLNWSLFESSGRRGLRSVCSSARHVQLTSVEFHRTSYLFELFASFSTSELKTLALRRVRADIEDLDEQMIEQIALPTLDELIIGNYDTEIPFKFLDPLIRGDDEILKLRLRLLITDLPAVMARLARTSSSLHDVTVYFSTLGKFIIVSMTQLN